MKALRDNIYEAIAAHNETTARQWRKSYVAPAACARAPQEFAALADYFFNAFSKLPGDYTRELSCIVGNSKSVDAWMDDFRSVVAPSFIVQARYIFAPTSDLTDTIGEFGQLLGAY